MPVPILNRLCIITTLYLIVKARFQSLYFDPNGYLLLDLRKADLFNVSLNSYLMPIILLDLRKADLFNVSLNSYLMPIILLDLRKADLFNVSVCKSDLSQNISFQFLLFSLLVSGFLDFFCLFQGDLQLLGSFLCSYDPAFANAVFDEQEENE